MPEDVSARDTSPFSFVPDSADDAAGNIIPYSSVPVSARVHKDISAVNMIMELGTVILGSAGSNIVDWEGTAIAPDSFVPEGVAMLVTDPQGAPIHPEVEVVVETPEPPPVMGNDSDGGGGGEASGDSQSVSQDHR
jgi:hypothetical protein